MSDPHPTRPPEKEDKRSFLQKVAEFIHPGPDSTQELIEVLADYTSEPSPLYLLCVHRMLLLGTPRRLPSMAGGYGLEVTGYVEKE